MPDNNVLDNVVSEPSVPLPTSPKLRHFGDVDAIRTNIFDKALQAASAIPSASNKLGHTLSLHDVHYSGPDKFSLLEQKRAILSSDSLHKRLRGTIRLTDKDGKVLDESTKTLALIPYLTQRGTFIRGGQEYSLSSQQRSKPAIYTRVKENKELESHVNFGGRGKSHHIELDPASNIFKLKIDQGHIPAITLLRALGVSDKELKTAWGEQIFVKNVVSDSPHKINDLFAKFVRGGNTKESTENKRLLLKDALAAMKMDPDVNKRTIGNPHDSYGKDAILDTTKKLLRVAKGEEEPDDRDHLAFQSVLGPEDLIANRFEEDRGKTFRGHLFTASRLGSLKKMPPRPLDHLMRAVFEKSGLGNSLEEINPSELIDQLAKITKMGEGGIKSERGIPEESKSVAPSQFGSIDLSKVPESGRAGVDSRVANVIRKGDDGNIYSLYKNMKSGQSEYKTAAQVMDSVIAFPNELNKNKPLVAAMVNGKTKYVPRDKVDYEFPHMENTFSPLSNLVALKSATKGQRVAMGARMITQALGLRNAEAPFVRSAMPDDPNKSFEEHHGPSVGAIRAKLDGRVTEVTRDHIKVKHTDGTEDTHELYNNFAFNRKSLIHNTPMVGVGDRFQAGQLLAKSNFTDDKGALALGLNARVGFMTARGLNTDDAVVMSESMSKKFLSDHLYQHKLDFEKNIRSGKSPFLTFMSSAYKPAQIKNLDENGIIKPGTVVKKGDPLILAMKERGPDANQLHRRRGPTYGNASEIWDHENEGIVTDIFHSPKGATVNVRSFNPSVVGDKFCYDEQTDILTIKGWKPISEVTLTDQFATLNDDDEIEYLYPTSVQMFPHRDKMYSLETPNVSLLVTDNHKLYIKSTSPNQIAKFVLVPASECYQHEFWLKNMHKSFCVNQRKKKDDKWVQYKGFVYCVTLPKYNILYIRRNHNELWCGNSNRYGGKGICSKIIKDDEMPIGEDGQPLEMLLSPLGVISRCYDDQTEFLTEEGWKFGKDVKDEDKIICYDTQTTQLHVMNQISPFHKARYKGRMLRFSNKVMDFCVTPNHKIWARCGYKGSKWQEVTAERIFKHNWTIPVTGKPIDGVEEPFTLPHIDYKKKDNASNKSDISIDAGDWAEFLGWYMSEGNTDEKAHISQSNSANPGKCEQITNLLNRLPFAWFYNPKNIQFHISDIRLCVYLKQFGLCHQKYIPDWLFKQPANIRQRFLDAYWAGDGSDIKTKAGSRIASASSRSTKLIDDVQRLLIYQGISSNKMSVSVEDSNCPMWRASHHFRQTRLLEAHNWSEVEYDGMIYCPTIPTGYLVTRRNGKNARLGNTNPSQVIETVLGKIAAKTGQPYKIKDFGDIEDLVDFTQKEMAKHNVKDLETLTDPKTGKTIPNVLTGRQFFMKLHHVAECFDDATQVRTSRGWVLWQDVTDDDLLATFENDKLIYEKPLKIIREPYVGDMYGYRKHKVDYLVTPNHRLYVNLSFTDEKVFMTAKELYNQHFYLYVVNEFDEPVKRVLVTKTNHYIVPYNGIVYCAEMRTGLLYVRRNYREMVSGNSKEQARGIGPNYTDEGIPAKGGETGSKRLGLLDSQALLSLGSTEVLRDAHVLRGTKNDDYWHAIRSGTTPPPPKVPPVYQKFLTHLVGSGINVLRSGPQLHIMALRDQDIDYLSKGRTIKNAETVSYKDLGKPIKGGLFDETIFGTEGNQWAHIPLNEPLPNPVMEEPIRKLLKLKQDQFDDIIGGKQELNGQTGPKAIATALANINVPKEIENCRAYIKSGKRSELNNTIARLSYLKACQNPEHGIHPKDWMMTKVPVIPPKFRPAQPMKLGGTPSVRPSNNLYKELFTVNELLKQQREVSDDLGSTHRDLYRAFKGVTGLGDPIQPANQKKKIKGLLSEIFGSSPKYSFLQMKLLGANTDLVGRATVAPNPEYDMDSIGLPEDKAWEVYKPFIFRNLIKRGYKHVAAAEAVSNKAEAAHQALVQEMGRRPVVVNRAPVLHRYGIMSFWPKLTKSHVLQTSPIIGKGFNLDYDGNCVDYDTLLIFNVNLNILQLSDNIDGGDVATSDSIFKYEFVRQLENTLMTLTGKTLIELSDKNNCQFTLKIGDFPRVGDPVVTKTGQLIYKMPDGVSISTYDHTNGKIFLAPITGFTVDKNHPCSKITTKRGRTINISDNESVCVFDKVTGNLKKEKPIDSQGKFIPYLKKDIITGTKYDRELGWWYAALVADGWVSGYQVGYSKNDGSKRAEVVRIARERIHDKFTTHEYFGQKGGDKFGDSAKVHLGGKDLVDKILPFVDPAHATAPDDERKALYKKIPDDLLFNGSEECLLGLLAGLFEGDKSMGWNTSMKKKRFYAKLDTSSPYLVESIQILLRKLGIRYSVTTCPPKGQSKTSYVVCPSLIDLYKVFPKCQFISDTEKTLVAEFLASPVGQGRPELIDNIPLTASLVESFSQTLLAMKLNTLYSTCRLALKTGSVGRYSAKKILDVIPKSFTHPHFDVFKVMTTNEDVHWDAVDTVEKIDNCDVFDLEVPSTKVYALANGLVVFDTMQFHVPSTDEAVEEAVVKMMPSANLHSVSQFKAHYVPQQDYITGLYNATAKKKDTHPRIFATKQDAMRAYFNDPNIGMDSPIRVLVDK